ncbi:MAG: hypothetical protein V1773_14935 [bacterium]
MNKQELQKEIFEKAYQHENWLEVLREFFGVQNIFQLPKPIKINENEFTTDAFELGSLITKDERLVGVYKVVLNSNVVIEKNRVGLRSLLRNIYKYDVDAALIVFLQDNKWRFSFVSEIRLEDGKKETEPKRYTYLFGDGEICRTAADRFFKLKGNPVYLIDLFDAFSVEKLNKEFFDKYKASFEKFCSYLVSQQNYVEIFTKKKHTQKLEG